MKLENLLVKAEYLFDSVLVRLSAPDELVKAYGLTRQDLELAATENQLKRQANFIGNLGVLVDGFHNIDNIRTAVRKKRRAKLAQRLVK